jgi:predicted nucleic acid-binding Zn ribbon protein
MYCTHCSAEIEEEHIFCPTCGKRLSEEPKTAKSFRWIKRLLWTLAIVALSAYLYFSSSSDPSDAVIGQLQSIGSNELTKAYYGYTSPAFQETTSLEAFKEFIKSHPDFSVLVKADVEERQEVDDKAILEMKLTPSKGAPFWVEYHLIKLEDGWKINALRQIKKSLPEENKT